MRLLATARTPTRSRKSLFAVTAGLVVAAAALTVTATRADAAVPAPPSGMTLVFGDDFSGAAGTGLDRDDWLYATGTGYPGGAANWGTNEIETMTDSTDNVYLDGKGHLAIKPIRDADGNWTSGRVETQRTDFAAPPGGKLRIQASLKQPDVSGAEATGYWPAFWALGAAARPVSARNWPGIGEWDIMEAINGRPSVFSTLHCGVAPGGPCNEFTGLGSGEHPCADCKTKFHTYAVEYDRSVSPEQLRWYHNDTMLHTVTADQMDATTWSNATQHGMFVILNVAIGGAFPAAFGGALPTAETRSGVPMLVDYVAIYQSKGATDPTSPASPKPSTSASPKPSTSTGPNPPAHDAYAMIEAESYTSSAETTGQPATERGQHVGPLKNGDWLAFDKVDFGAGGVSDFVGRVASGADKGVSGLVEVRIDSRDSQPIGSFAVADTGGWKSWSSVPGSVTNVTGVHTVYLTFTSGQPADFVNVNSFKFRR